MTRARSLGHERFVLEEASRKLSLLQLELFRSNAESSEGFGHRAM